MAKNNNNDNLVWYSDFDDFGNVFFSAFSPFEEGFEYRFEPRVINDKKIYVNTSDEELIPEGDEKLTWETTDKAKEYFAQSHKEWLDIIEERRANGDYDEDEVEDPSEEAYKEHQDYTK